MSGATASLLIIVLHYRNLADTIECLNSIAAQTYANIRTILIDNGSNDSPLTDLTAGYPGVELVTLAENLGWSGGNNVGIRAALAQGVDFVCLLNNDTVLPQQAMERLMATATALGACLLHPAIDSYGVDDSVQLDPTIPQPAYLTVVPVPAVPDVYEISAVNGACLLVHRAVFVAIGLIDERFFLLCEDADFARRAMRVGFRMYCDAGVRIQHKESRAFGGRRQPIKTYYGFRNTLLYYEKHENHLRKSVKLVRDLAWTAWGTAQAAGARPGSWWGLVRWAVSADAFARAARMGVRDYFLRRFGRIRAKDAEALKR